MHWEDLALSGAARQLGARTQLEGIHHITAICADAPGNMDFYARVLELRR